MSLRMSLYNNSADFRWEVSLYRCPILLSFVCLLVRKDDIDLSSQNISTGEFIPNGSSLVQEIHNPQRHTI